MDWSMIVECPECGKKAFEGFREHCTIVWYCSECGFTEEE